MSVSKLYHYPRLSSLDLGLLRSPGAGLGNLLLPVSRAIIGASERGGELVYPTFRQVKFGPLIRGEREKRFYSDIFRGRHASDWNVWLASRLGPKMSEVDAKEKALPSEKTVIVYEGLAGYFHDIQGHRQLISNWLDENCRYNGLIEGPYDIAIHVRLGDFVARDTLGNGQSIRQSFDWYKTAFEAAKMHFDTDNLRCVLFTDEDPSMVANSLDLQGCIEFDPGANAITSMRNMSKAKLVITSRSSFSMWGVYLGDCKAVWDAGFDLETRMPVRESLDYFHRISGALV